MLDVKVDRIDLLTDYITNLASEGVPVACIARSFRFPTEEIRNTLKQSIGDGRLVELPVEEWRVQRSERDKVGSARGRSFDDLLTLVMRAFRLTRSQAVIVAALAQRELLSKEQLHQIYEYNRPHSEKSHRAANIETEPKLIDVLVCHARKRLATFFVEIDTMWGRGYVLRPAMRERVYKLLDAYLNGEDIERIEFVQEVPDVNDVAAAV